jgi:hypothetical protein
VGPEKAAAIPEEKEQATTWLNLGVQSMAEDFIFQANIAHYHKLLASGKGRRQDCHAPQAAGRRRSEACRVALQKSSPEGRRIGSSV